MIVIVDTNFLIYCAKYKIDLLSELNNLYSKFEIIVPKQVFSELQKLKEGHSRANFTSSLAFEMMKNMITTKKIEIKEMLSKNADEEIVNLVENMQKNENVKKIVVGTMDIKLSDKIKRLGAGIIKIRQKNKICEE